MPSSRIPISIARTPEGAGLALPEYATSGAAGMDLLAACESEVTIPPGGRALIPAGIRIALPAGYEAQVRPRSGLALKYGITCLNSPGTIDSDYRGAVGVILANLSGEAYTIRRGDRIAQMVIAPVTHAEWDERDILPETERGHGGFGHTG